MAKAIFLSRFPPVVKYLCIIIYFTIFPENTVSIFVDNK